MHVEKFVQLDLFWFRSHSFLLRLMQLLLFMLVLLVTCMIRFRSLLFPSSAYVFLLPLLLLLVPLLVLGSLAFAIPIFTIIIHIGNLSTSRSCWRPSGKGRPRGPLYRPIMCCPTCR